MGDGAEKYAWLIFIPINFIIVTQVSKWRKFNGWIDGLAAGTSAIIVLTLGIFTWISGNIIFLLITLDIMFIARAGWISSFL